MGHFLTNFNIIEGIMFIRNELATFGVFYRGVIFAIATMIIGSGLLLMFKSIALLGKSLYGKLNKPYEGLR
ncbi:hypothetical protein NEF87_003880 [Candidatus Lokiarchaeum ossiferum]|uniref:Uncharacterized protein n=2 Tax=Candidatus Lokiarchaeum ossiferum TaxID=2951803 RepID=A0ABY6HVR0_9ARCH|nr:hypothetical protein NEF87_003880 [Candidatus Lokiarchaeum sp. B-35]